MHRVIEYLKSHFTVKATVIGAVALLLTLSVIGISIKAMEKDIQFNDNGSVFNAKIYSRTVASALKEAGIVLREGDELSHSLEDKLPKNAVVSINRAKAVNVVVSGDKQVVYTTLETVGDVISKLEIPLGEENLALTPLDAAVENDMTVEIIPKIYEEVVETIEIPFETVQRPSSNMEKGVTRVATNGENGEKQIVYKVLTHNGEVLDKQYVSEAVTKKPVLKVVEYGTIATIKTSRGDSFRYSKALTVTASAYTAASTGKSASSPGYGVTASGAKAKRGVIAVDPSVIPLGSRLYIEAANGSWVYGYAVAADTGGSIKGNKIDLYMDSISECLSFGRRSAKVYILE